MVARSSPQSIDPWGVQRQPACCVGVEVVPRNLGGVTLKSYGEAICRCGSHRVVETERFRTVQDIRKGSASVWQGNR